MRETLTLLYARRVASCANLRERIEFYRAANSSMMAEAIRSIEELGAAIRKVFQS